MTYDEWLQSIQACAGVEHTTFTEDERATCSEDTCGTCGEERCDCAPTEPGEPRNPFVNSPDDWEGGFADNH